MVARGVVPPRDVGVNGMTESSILRPCGISMRLAEGLDTAAADGDEEEDETDAAEGAVD